MSADRDAAGDDGHVTWVALERGAAALIGRREARWITERVSGYSHAELVVHGDEPVPARAVAFLDALVARRRSGEPIQYVLGRWGFRTLELYVDARVLIPRPETELTAGIAIEQLAAAASDAGAAPVAADLGTGSGAIALSLAAEVPRALVWATDRSAAALAVARANVAGVGGRIAPRVRLAEGSWYEALPADLRGRLAVVVSNPPYVAPDDEIGDDVRAYEPHAALFAADGGFADVAHLLEQAPHWLAPGGSLVVELGPALAQRAVERAHACGLVDVAVQHDLAGRERVLVARARS